MVGTISLHEISKLPPGCITRCVPMETSADCHLFPSFMPFLVFQFCYGFFSASDLFIYVTLLLLQGFTSAHCKIVWIISQAGENLVTSIAASPRLLHVRLTLENQHSVFFIFSILKNHIIACQTLSSDPQHIYDHSTC